MQTSMATRARRRLSANVRHPFFLLIQSSDGPGLFVAGSSRLHELTAGDSS
jgi:hypothetical protein